jgi:hypothetical protein
MPVPNSDVRIFLLCTAQKSCNASPNSDVRIFIPRATDLCPAARLQYVLMLWIFRHVDHLECANARYGPRLGGKIATRFSSIGTSSPSGMRTNQRPYASSGNRPISSVAVAMAVTASASIWDAHPVLHTPQGRHMYHTASPCWHRIHDSGAVT